MSATEGHRHGPPADPVPGPGSTRSLWRAWVTSVTAGECAGFTAPAVVGALSTAWPTAVEVPVLIAAGAVEGAALGWSQARVLRRVLPQLDIGAYVRLTAAAASIAYLIGLVPMLAGDRLLRLPMPVLAVVTAVLAAMLLSVIGTAQWLVLRRTVRRSASWIATTAAAWAAGLVVFMAVAPPLWQPGQPVGLVIAIGIVAGLAMAAVVAALTGWAVVHLNGRADVVAAGMGRARS